MKYAWNKSAAWIVKNGIPKYAENWRYESFIILALIIKNNFPKYAEKWRFDRVL